MTTRTMTGCDRVNRISARQDRNRTPRHDSFWPEIISRRPAEARPGDCHDTSRLFESDFDVHRRARSAPFSDQTITRFVERDGDY